MDISAEKAEVIKQFNLVNDIDLVRAIKSLLDLGLRKQGDSEAALKASIGRAISDSEKGMVRLYEEFISDMRKRYSA